MALRPEDVHEDAAGREQRKRIPLDEIGWHPANRGNCGAVVRRVEATIRSKPPETKICKEQDLINIPGELTPTKMPNTIRSIRSRHPGERGISGAERQAKSEPPEGCKDIVRAMDLGRELLKRKGIAPCASGKLLTKNFESIVQHDNAHEKHAYADDVSDDYGSAPVKKQKIDDDSDDGFLKDCTEFCADMGLFTEASQSSATAKFKLVADQPGAPDLLPTATPTEPAIPDEPATPTEPFDSDLWEGVFEDAHR